MCKSVESLIDVIRNSIGPEIYNSNVDFINRSIFSQPKVRINANERNAAKELRTFLRALEAATEKKQYGRHSASEWKKWYVFPSADDVEIAKIHFSSRGVNESEFINGTINKDENDVIGWLDSYLNLVSSTSVSSDSTISFICGGIGSGKSTFLRYVISTNGAKFVKNRVVPSRIEAMKMLRDFPSGDIDKDQYFEEYVKRRLVRDFILFHYGDVSERISYPTSVSEKDVTRDIGKYLGDEQPTTTFQSKIAFQINRFAKNVRENPLTLRNEINRISIDVIDAILHLATRMKIVFLPIFDGFDRINVSELIVSERGSKILPLLTNWMFARFCQLPLRTCTGAVSVRVSPLVCVRNNSVSYYMAAHTRLGARAECAYYYIVAPSLQSILMSTYSQIWQSKLEDNKYEGDDLLNLLFRALTNRENEPSNQVTQVFNDNVRFFLHYLQDVIFWMLREASSLQECRCDYFDYKRYIQEKWYRMFHILLTSDSKQFHNFVSVSIESEGHEGKTGGIYCYADDTHNSGYLDNLYNYHCIDGESHALLDKIRICRIVEELTRDNEVSAVLTQEIEDRYEAIYGRKIMMPHETIAILLRGGFLVESMSGGFVASVDRNRVSFALEPLARFCITNEIYLRLPYIETVISKTLLPRLLGKHLSPEQRDPDDLNLFNWTVTSIQNSMLLYLYVEYIEEAEKTPSEYRISERMKERLLQNYNSLCAHEPKYIPALIDRMNRRFQLRIKE